MREEETRGITYIPCFLCGESLDIRETKRKKPYFICDFCGLQVFVRRKSGIQRFDNFLKKLSNEPVVTSESSPALHSFVLISRLHLLQERLKVLQNRKSPFDFLGPDQELARGIAALESEILQVRKELSG